MNPSHRPARSFVLAAVALAAAVSFAGTASAEEVVLASGTRYEATKVELVYAAGSGEGANASGTVRFTYPVGGGSATVALPFDRIEPHNMFGLVLARTPVGDAKAQLALAAFALDRGLLAEAQNRFRKAAAMDPTLVPDRDAGLAAVKTVEAQRVLEVAEAEFRRGRYAQAIDGAKSALAKAGADSPTGVKAAALSGLATRLEERDHVRLAAEAKAKADAQVAAEAQAFGAALEKADKTILQAVEHRNQVATPGLSTSQAVRDLEAADTLLREGRRLLVVARDLAGVHADDVAKRDRDALAILVANHLDLADLYRQQGRFDKARERVRVAMILDPQSTRGPEIQRQIEDDLRNPPYAPTYTDAPYSTFSSGFLYSWPYYRGFSSYCPCTPRSYSPYRSNGFGSGFGWNVGGNGWRFTVGW